MSSAENFTHEGGASGFSDLSPFRHRIFFLLLPVVPLLLLAMLEFGLRIADYGRPRPPLFIPAGNEYPGKLTINPHIATRYFRDQRRRPYPTPLRFAARKPANGYRIFMLGGSTAIGWPYSHNMAPSRILERRLKDAFPERSIDIINVALTAVNTYTLLDFVDELLAQEPDAVLIYAGHNEFYGALGVGSTESVGRHPWLVKSYLWLQRFRTFAMVGDLVAEINALFSGAIPDAAQSSTLMERVVSDANIPYQGSTYQEGAVQFSDNLREILGRLTSAGVRVVISELVSNVGDQAPLISRPASANAKAEETYRQARMWEQVDEFVLATKAYRRAKDLDVVRFRAPDHFNGIIRRLGREFQVPVVPMQSYFAAASPHGVVGSELMLDHLHPNIDGYFLMSEAFFDTIRTARLISDRWPKEIESTARDRDTWGVTQLDQVLASLRITELMDHWPFKPLEESGKGFAKFEPNGPLEALALSVLGELRSPVAAHRIWANELAQQGDKDGALREYLAMIAIAPHEIDLYREAAWFCLQNDRLDDALPVLLHVLALEPVDEASKWVGQIYLRKGDFPLAIHYFEQAVRLSKEPDAQLVDLLRLAYERSGRRGGDAHISQPTVH